MVTQLASQLNVLSSSIPKGKNTIDSVKSFLYESKIAAGIDHATIYNCIYYYFYI